MAFTKGFKIGMVVVAAAAVVGGIYYLQNFRPPGQAASVPQIEGMKDLSGSGHGPAFAPVPEQELPSGVVVNASGKCRVNIQVLAWNAEMGLMYANGGRETAKGSLMDRAGVNAVLLRQDDYGPMQEQMLAFAKALPSNACPTEGAAFTVIMGDALPGFASGVVPQMTALNSGIEAFGAIGKSAGEDACMLPYAVAKNPQLARGMIIAAVARDGDIHTCYGFLDLNKIPFNPDPNTYDPDTLNIAEFSSFMDADQAFITNRCEMRPIVRAGKRTGQVTRGRRLAPNEKDDGVPSGCIDGTATWTPGDVNVAMQKGGVTKVASTKVFGNQMAAIVIGNRDFNVRHPEIVKGILKAAFAGGDQVRSSDKALLFAGGVSAKVYKAQDAAYWAEFFKGVTKKDKLGVDVSLGGSIVMNAADNADYFGLSGGEDKFHIVYDRFGKQDVAYYPSVMPSYPAYEQVVNLSYLKEIIAETGVTADSSENRPVFERGRQIDRVVAQANYTINFDTGKATIRPDSLPVLKQLRDELVVATMAVEINGHTDSTGNPESNIALSKARADAVKDYLTAHAPSSFGPNRIVTHGYGQNKPVANNKTAAGKAQNRRVEIIVGTVGQ